MKYMLFDNDLFPSLLRQRLLASRQIFSYPSSSGLPVLCHRESAFSHLEIMLFQLFHNDYLSRLIKSMLRSTNPSKRKASNFKTFHIEIVSIKSLPEFCWNLSEVS